MLEKLSPGWRSLRQASSLLRRVGDTVPSPDVLVANACFGHVAEHERLALEGLIAGEDCSARVAATRPPDQHPTDSVD